MNIGYLQHLYPEERCIINKAENISYEQLNKIYDIKFVVNKLKDKVTRKGFRWDTISTYSPVISPKVDIIHTFNQVCDTKLPWCVTFESTVPRNNFTVNRRWERSDILPVDKFTVNQVDLLRASNCFALFALSESTYRIQKYFLDTYFGYCSDEVMNKTLVLKPPQVVLASEKDISIKFKNQKINMIFVGHDFFRKGGYIALKALDRIKDSFDFQFTVVSKLNRDSLIPVSEKEYQECVEMINSCKWIRYYETLDNSEVLKLCQSAHIGLLPTFQDTFGYSVLEMQACGCPCLTTNIRALPEINSNINGWICEIPIDNIGGEGIWNRESFEVVKNKLINDTVNTLAAVLLDTSILYDKSIKSLNNIIENHSLKKYSDVLVKYYNKAISR